MKIVRLATSILIDEELENSEIELLANLDKKKEEKQQSSLAVGDARRAVEQFKDNYEMLVADDKTLDKMFRKEFSELDTHTIDVLYRLFKKRPRYVCLFCFVKIVFVCFEGMDGKRRIRVILLLNN